VALLAALPSTSDNLASAMGVDALRVRAVLTASLLVVALVLRRPAADVVRRLAARLPGAVRERFVGGPGVAATYDGRDGAPTPGVPRGEVWSSSLEKGAECS